MKLPIRIALVLLGLAACDAKEKEQAWIVLNFKLPDGRPAQMTFNNTQAPDTTLEECRRDLPDVQASLVEAAKAKETQLADATFTGAECVWSATDPTKPKG